MKALSAYKGFRGLYEYNKEEDCYEIRIYQEGEAYVELGFVKCKEELEVEKAFKLSIKQNLITQKF